MPLRLMVISLFTFCHLTAPGMMAQAASGAPAPIPPAPPVVEIRTDTPSGLPVPRFVSLKQAKTPCRLGPSLDHPILYTFQRQGLPVLVVAETTDNWRKIRDIAGDECWAHRITLRAQTHVIATEDVHMLARPKPGAPLRARVAGGAMVRLEGRKGGWAQLSFMAPPNAAEPAAATGGKPRAHRKTKGWADASTLWGADPVRAIEQGPLLIGQ